MSGLAGDAAVERWLVDTGRAGRFGAIRTPPVDEDQTRVNEHEPVKEALDAASIAGLSE
jgi:hypothetical protein